jgi:hypothetical protein
MVTFSSLSNRFKKREKLADTATLTSVDCDSVPTSPTATTPKSLIAATTTKIAGVVVVNSMTLSFSVEAACLRSIDCYAISTSLSRRGDSIDFLKSQYEVDSDDTYYP